MEGIVSESGEGELMGRLTSQEEIGKIGSRAGFEIAALGDRSVLLRLPECPDLEPGFR